MVLVIVALGFASVLFHALAYLLLLPDYLCFKNNSIMQNYQCTPGNFCSDADIKTERISNQNSLDNWIEEFGLKCHPESSFMHTQMCLYAGVALGAVVISPLSDIFGRKPVFFGSLLAVVLAYVLLLLSKDFQDV